jgi:AraC-like DNA-binding protein
MQQKRLTWWIAPKESPIPLAQRLIHAGQSIEVADYCFHGLKRGESPYTILQYTLSGEGQLDYEGARYRIRSGDLMVVTVPHDHIYQLPSHASHWEFSYVILAGEEAIRLTQWAIEQDGPVHQLGSQSAFVRQSQRIHQLAIDPLEPLANPFRNAMEAYALLMHLTNNVQRSLTRNLPEPLAHCVTWIDENFDGAFSMEDLAARAGMSRSHFSRQFRRYIGESPQPYVQRLRMRRAARLLTELSMSVEATARAIGIDDPNYFIRVFKRHHGQSPSRFRRTII